VLAYSHKRPATLIGLPQVAAPSTTQHTTSAPVGQEEPELVRPMLDASDEGEIDILGCDLEGEDLPLRSALQHEPFFPLERIGLKWLSLKSVFLLAVVG